MIALSRGSRGPRRVRKFRLTDASKQQNEKRLRVQFAEGSRLQSRVQVNRKLVPYE